VSIPTGPDNRPRPIISPFAFDSAEHRARVANAQRAMAAHGMDALLLTDDRNGFYFSGAGGATPREDKARPQFVLIPEAGEVVALVSHARCIPFRESSWIAEVRTYDGLEPGLVRDALARLVAEAAPRARTIGMELGYEQRLGMPLADYEALRGRFPERRFVDAALPLWSLRMVKSPAEQARLERAVQITDQAYAAVLPTIRPGMTEREIVGRLHGEMARQGASTSWCIVQSGTYDRGGLVLRDRPVEPGEMVWFDMGANVLGYWADFSRAVVLGVPTAHQRDTWDKIHEVTDLAMAAVRPGATVADVARVADHEMARRGLVFNTWGARYGHGFGLQTTEPPHVARYDDTVISAGMALTLEPGTCTPGGRFQIEQNFLVTDHGLRLLSQAPWELVVVPA
jgi:Xaa-Pro dipeptidase